MKEEEFEDTLIENETTNPFVGVVSETSSFAELTKFLNYSFQESDGEVVENILANREKGLLDELEKLRKERDGVLEKSTTHEIMMKREILEKSRYFGEMMERELALVKVEKLKVEKELRDQQREFEGEIGELKMEIEVYKESICKRIKVAEKEVSQLKLANGFEMEAFSGDLSSIDCSGGLENQESHKRVCDLELRKSLHSEICKDKYEVSGTEQSSDREKGLIEELDKMRRERDMLVTERSAIEKNLELELGKSREYETMLKREKGLIDELDKMRREQDMLVTERSAIEKNLELELGKSRDYETMLKRERDMMEKKNLSLVSLEILKVENESKKHQREFEDKIEILEMENSNLKRERDMMEINASRASLEKLKVENESKKHQKELEDKIEILERKNSELRKEFELYKESLCERMKSVEKETRQLKVANGGPGNGYEIGCSSPDPSSMYYSAKTDNSDSHERVHNLEFRQRKIHPEICLDNYEACGSEQSSKNLSPVESKCSEERTTSVQLGEFERVKETRWKTRLDMLSTLVKDPELCMSAVCALYRRHISAVKSNDSIGLRSFDTASGTATAKYLINNDPMNKLSRSVSEVQQDSPSTIETCFKMAAKDLAQLFEMYQKKLDPFFCPES